MHRNNEDPPRDTPGAENLPFDPTWITTIKRWPLPLGLLDWAVANLANGGRAVGRHQQSLRNQYTAGPLDVGPFHFEVSKDTRGAVKVVYEMGYGLTCFLSSSEIIIKHHAHTPYPVLNCWFRSYVVAGQRVWYRCGRLTYSAVGASRDMPATLGRFAEELKVLLPAAYRQSGLCAIDMLWGTYIRNYHTPSLSHLSTGPTHEELWKRALKVKGSDSDTDLLRIFKP